MEARHQEYPSTVSFLKLRNLLTVHELGTEGGRYIFVSMEEYLSNPAPSRTLLEFVCAWSLC